MKAKFKKIICLVAITFYVSLSCRAENGKYHLFHDNLGSRDLRHEQIICISHNSNKYLNPYKKYVFRYDEYNRVSKKEVFNWNGAGHSWECSYSLSYMYNDATMTIEYARWNKEMEAYDPYTQRAVYTLKQENVISYHFFKKEVTESDWEVVTNLTDIPSEAQWIEKQLLLAKFL